MGIVLGRSAIIPAIKFPVFFFIIKLCEHSWIKTNIAWFAKAPIKYAAIKASHHCFPLKSTAIIICSETIPRISRKLVKFRDINSRTSAWDFNIALVLCLCGSGSSEYEKSFFIIDMLFPIIVTDNITIETRFIS